MFCPSCGSVNNDSAQFCASCGQPMNQQPRQPQQPQVVVEDGVSALIPRNTAALWAYYLGVASLACCILAGIPAMIMGFKALNNAKENPALKGENHAWVGIILGGLSVIAFIVIVIMSLAGSFN